MASDDDERTVLGQKIPPQPPQQQQPVPPAGPYGQHPAQPPAQQPMQPPAQQPSPQGPPPGSEDTWLGGALTPTRGAPVAPPQQQPYPPQQPQQPYPPQQPYGQQPGAAPAQPQAPYQQQPYPAPQAPAPQPPAPGYGQQYPPVAPQAPQQGQPYPQPGAYPAPQQPAPGYPAPPGQPAGVQFPAAPVQQEQMPQPHAVPRIAFNDALKGTGLGIGTSSNPMIAAASDLLILLGRLRTGIVEMQAIPLRDHVINEINKFVEKCQGAGLPPEDIDTARYALAATADDFVQNLPGSDPQYWQQFSMAAQLLGDRSAGIGFFTRLEQVMAYPSQRAHVLELMLTCLALGFKGRYRTDADGDVTLARWRKECYQRLRSAVGGPGADLSHKWFPVLLGGRQNRSAVPLWVIGSVAAGMVLAMFATLSWLLSTEANAAQQNILSLHQFEKDVILEGGEDVEVYVAPTTGQLERIQGRLAQDIESGAVTVLEDGDWVSVRLGSALQFRSGRADLQSDVSAMMQRIGAALEAEPGAILIEGHSDNIPLSGTGRYRTNEVIFCCRI